jgi:hypothetical protein
MRKDSSSYRKSALGIVKRPSERADRTLGYRYEMKYIISESKAQVIARFIEPYLKLDHYSRLQSSAAYPIVSLYLDSPDLQLCRESLEGHKNRFKLRIRSYTDDSDYPRFFEIKRRVGTIIIKSRARVMTGEVGLDALLSGLSLPPQSYKGHEETLKQFRLYTNSIAAGPVIRVRYLRRAYESDTENRVRVTFDRQLAYNVGDKADVLLAGSGWQRHSIKGVILEIKFTGRYPAWLGRMTECFELHQQSVSKYATSIKNACLLGFCAPKGQWTTEDGRKMMRSLPAWK